jgi:glycosyltransferase involved in cell wall biosynthesis
MSASEAPPATATPTTTPAADGRPLIYICGLDPTAYANGHVSYVRAHALAASALGFSPQIFCVAPRASIEPIGCGVLHRVASPIRHPVFAPTHLRPIRDAVAAYLERCGHRPPHLIHSFGPWAAAAASAGAAASRRQIEVVTVASAYTTIEHEWTGNMRGLSSDHGLRARLRYHGFEPWVRGVASRVERRGYEQVQLVLVNYDSVARLLRESCRPGVRIRRLPYAAPAGFGGPSRAPTPTPDAVTRLVPPDAPLVVSVARHVARKGVDVLLRALALLRDNGIAFRACLVGPGRLLGDHRRLAESLGLDDTVAIPGEVPDVAPYLQHADVFVLPSLEEGSGSVALLEALQSGTAIVATACDGIAEDLLDGRDALLVPPGDCAALAGAIGRLLRDSELQARLGANGRRLHRERFSAEGFVGALGDTYAELGVTP